MNQATALIFISDYIEEIIYTIPYTESEYMIEELHHLLDLYKNVNLIANEIIEKENDVIRKNNTTEKRLYKNDD